MAPCIDSTGRRTSLFPPRLLHHDPDDRNEGRGLAVVRARRVLPRRPADYDGIAPPPHPARPTTSRIAPPRLSDGSPPSEAARDRPPPAHPPAIRRRGRRPRAPRSGRVAYSSRRSWALGARDDLPVRPPDRLPSEDGRRDRGRGRASASPLGPERLGHGDAPDPRPRLPIRRPPLRLLRRAPALVQPDDPRRGRRLFPGARRRDWPGLWSSTTPRGSAISSGSTPSVGWRPILGSSGART